MSGKEGRKNVNRPKAEVKLLTEAGSTNRDAGPDTRVASFRLTRPQAVYFRMLAQRQLAARLGEAERAITLTDAIRAMEALLAAPGDDSPDGLETLAVNLGADIFSLDETGGWENDK